MTKIIAAAALATLIGCGGAHAGTYDDDQEFVFHQDVYDHDLKFDREMHAMGECIVAQIKARGWASRGPRDEILARYQGYAERCYDAIKPSAMDPHGDDAELAKNFYIIAMQGALKCHLDDPAVSVNDDLSNAPMTCTDPTARKARESHDAADYLARSRH